jgi:sigma-E factor negative regulatory protein RseA
MDGISALMDGELEAQEAQRHLARLKDDAELRDRWDSFHVIGDALRGERPLLLSLRFHEALAKALAEEPTVLAPRRTIPTPKRVTTYALSAAASLSAVALVAWVAVSPTAPVAPLANMAQGPVKALPVAAADPAPLTSVPSEGRMNEYLLAHQGFSPSTTLQGLAPYIRSVSTRPAERR